MNCLSTYNTVDCLRILRYFYINPLKAEFNPICHLLALLGAHHIFHISGLRVNCITNCMSIYHTENCKFLSSTSRSQFAAFVSVYFYMRLVLDCCCHLLTPFRTTCLVVEYNVCVCVCVCIYIYIYIYIFIYCVRLLLPSLDAFQNYVLSP